MKHLSSMLAVLVMAAMASAPAQADSFLPQIGGKGGAQYSARCPQGLFLHGFEVRAGDDIDAIRAVCVTASSPVDIGAPPLTNGFGTDWHGGGGGSLRRLLCPPGTPVVAGIVAGYDGIDTVSLDTIDIYCGEISARVSIGQYPSNVLHAPVQGCTLGPNLVVPTWNLTKNKIFGNGRCPHFEQAQQRCPMGEVGIGMHGHSGALVDAMGLICGPAPALQKIPPAMGHVESAPRLTPLQKAVKGAQLERPSGSVASARIQSSGAKLAPNPQPLPPGQPSRDANDKAIIIVGGKAAATRHAADHPARSPGFANGASGVTHDRNQPDNGSSADCLYALDGRGRLLRFTHQA
ncbi:MAG TPA: hypothetical protein VFN09_05095, partial [Rhodanobacteraceae bacterium]|nr:hypothetical protein [Rhodanobacteraceae bacterium]